MSVLEFTSFAHELESELTGIWHSFLIVCDKLANLGLALKKLEHRVGYAYSPNLIVVDKKKWILASSKKSGYYDTYYYKTVQGENLVPLREGLFQPDVEGHIGKHIQVPADDPDVLAYREAARAFINKATAFDDKAKKLSEMACNLFNDLQPIFKLFDLIDLKCTYNITKLFASYHECELVIYLDADYTYINELFGLKKDGMIKVAGPTKLKDSKYYETICEIVANDTLVEEIIKNPDEFKDLIDELK